MWPTLKPSQRVAVVGSIDPQSATTAKSTGWIDASQFNNFMAEINIGAITATGTVDAKIQQASDSGGTGAKDITGKAITQVVAGSVQCLINVKQEDLDVANSFNFIKLVITPATAASLISGTVKGLDPRYGGADLYAAATQTQIVG
jgi:hypothetical protein